MFIDVEDLRPEPLQVRNVYAAGQLHLEHPDAAADKPVSTEFVLTHHGRELHIEGTVETGIHFRCSRCLKETDQNLTAGFSLNYRPQPKGLKGDEEIELKYEEMEIAYYDGIRLDVDLMVLEQLELSIPMRYVCREDCKGLCAHCGADLNDAPCGCTEEESDSRLAALLEFRRKMEK